MNRFEGDGRAALSALPEDTLIGTQPMRVRRSMCRQLVENFKRTGRSSHSAAGGVLWVLVEHCRVNNVPHKTNRTLSGWTIEKQEEEPCA